MKKRSIGLLMCIMATLVMVACSSKTGDLTSSSEEIVVPEDSVIPDAAKAVEKIINNEDVIEITDNSTMDPIEVDEPVKVDVTIFYVFGDYSAFQQSEEQLDEEYTADDLLGRLIVHNIAPVDAKVLDFEIVTESDSTRSIRLNLSDSFRAYLGTMSDNAEESILASLVDTYLFNYDADRLYLTVDGKNLKTNTGEYKEPFGWAERPLNKDKK